MAGKKAGAPQAGLYLRVDTGQVEEMLRALREVFMVMNASEYDKNMHVMELYGDEEAEIVRPLVQLIQSQGVVALIREDVEMALKTEADGVIVDSLEALKAAKEEMDDDSICALSIKQAEEVIAREAMALGADCLYLEQDSDVMAQMKALVTLAGVFDKPLAISGAVTNDTAGDLVHAGAMFLECSAYIFEHEKGAAQGASNMLYAIELASAQGATAVN